MLVNHQEENNKPAWNKH